MRFDHRIRKIIAFLLAIICIIPCVSGCSKNKKIKRISAKEFRKCCEKKDFNSCALDIVATYDDEPMDESIKEWECYKDEHGLIQVVYFRYKNEKSAEKAFKVFYDSWKKTYERDEYACVEKAEKEGNVMVFDVAYDEDGWEEKVHDAYYNIRPCESYSIFILAEDTIICARTQTLSRSTSTIKKARKLVDETINDLCY